MSSEIHLKNIVMVTLEEVSEDARKAFEEHQKIAEERREAAKARQLPEFLACFKQDRQGVVTQVKQAVLPPLNDKTEVIPNVSTWSPSVTYEDVSGMFVAYTKNIKSQVQHMIEEV